MKPTVVRINTDIGSGSGVIVQTQDSAGYIVTNEHVIDGASQISVTVNDSAVYDAQLLGVDAVRDLAVITICCSTFRSIQFGDVSGLRPTAEVLIVGYPRSLPGQATFTQGIVSAVRFNPELQSEVFQTDAAINPGNSGGPMVSLGGELLGIVTLKLSDSEGVGFAVSADVVLQRLPMLWASASPPPPIPTPIPISHPGVDDGVLEERIQDLLNQLRPTATVGTMPVPQPTQGNTPVPTPPPPTRTPTPHPCSLAEIAHPDELEIVWTQTLAASPAWQSSAQHVQEYLQRLFEPTAAAYTIEFVANPLAYTSFPDYLGRVGAYTSSDGVRMRARFQSLLEQGLLPSPNGSLHEYNQRHAADPCTMARSRVFADDDIMRLLAVGYIPNAFPLNPLLAGSLRDILIRKSYQFRSNDIATPLIFWVIEEYLALAEDR